jgi:elongation factor G
MQNGVLAGYPVESLKVKLLDGSFHAVDSDALSFEIAAKIAFKEACKKAKPILLEPIMKVEIVTPDDYIGDVTGDVNKRRGVLKEIDAKVAYQVVKADVPLSNMFGYVTTLRTLSSGRATSTMQFSHFTQAPAAIVEEVITNIKGIKS